MDIQDYDYEGAGAGDVGPQDRLAKLTDAVKRANAASAEIADLEARLKTAQQGLNDILEKEVPVLMDEAGGITEWRLGNIKVSLKEDIFASDKEEGRLERHIWLVKHKYGAIIKTNYAIAFGSGEEEQAREQKVAEALKKIEGVDFERKRAIHPQTLSATVREIDAKYKKQNNNMPLPKETLELLGACRKRVAKLKLV
jgi:hypothetical protein